MTEMNVLDGMAMVSLGFLFLLHSLLYLAN